MRTDQREECKHTQLETAFCELKKKVLLTAFPDLICSFDFFLPLYYYSLTLQKYLQQDREEMCPKEHNFFLFFFLHKKVRGTDLAVKD